MQIPIIAMNFLYAILGVVLMYATYRVIDMLTPQVDFHDELKKGNIAVAIFLGPRLTPLDQPWYSRPVETWREP